MMLAREVVKGKYPEIPSHYSDELKLLVKHLLNVDPKRRPNIYQVCTFPKIKEYIIKVMNMEVFQEEFSMSIQVKAAHQQMQERKEERKQANALGAPKPSSGLGAPRSASVSPNSSPRTAGFITAADVKMDNMMNELYKEKMA